MSKTIVIFGATDGPASMIARAYGRQGYHLVLVDRQAAPLHELAGELGQSGIDARVFIADLSIPEHAAAMVASIRRTVCSIDAVYFGPPSAQAAVLTNSPLENAQEWSDLLYFSMVAILSRVLPEMLSRQSGDIWVAQANLPAGLGAGPAMAAARSYLHSLRDEVSGQGVQIEVLEREALADHKRSQQSYEIRAMVSPDLYGSIPLPARIANTRQKSSLAC